MAHGWGNSNRRSRLPADWQKRRAEVFRRAGGRCQWVDAGIRCPSPATDCDHIRAGDDHSLDNLQALCSPHHNRKTVAERPPPLPPRKRPRERHPGSL